jgi:hypothetical protein
MKRKGGIRKMNKEGEIMLKSCLKYEVWSERLRSQF